MNFSKITAVIFGVIFIIILYVIIYYALKIMYKDVKTGSKKRPQKSKRNYGLEVISAGDNFNIKVGSVIPIRDVVTIGRKEENTIVIPDPHVSGNHARIIVKNNILYVEDLNSTNGVFVNNKRVENKIKLFGKDEITIGTVKFKVLG